MPAMLENHVAKTMKNQSLENEEETDSYISPESIHRAVTRVCAQSALLLLQHGAETAVVDQTATRLGLALGMQSVELAITSNSLVVTTLRDGQCMTTTRRSADRGINMQVVTEVQHILFMVERKHISLHEVQERLNALKPLRYPRWLVVSMIGLSCGSFAFLAGGNFISCTIACIASAIAMYCRLVLAGYQFNPLLNFCASAFVASSMTMILEHYEFGGTPDVAVASSVLLFVPGFPLINSLSDMVKGYTNTGLARWAIATLLTISTCIGIMIAMSIWEYQGWN